MLHRVIAKQSWKTILLLLMLSALLFLAVGSTVAYLRDSAYAADNSFVAARSPVPVIHGEFDGVTRSNVRISSGSEGASLVRAAVLVCFVNEDGTIQSQQPVEGQDYQISFGENWKWENGFWYYQKIVNGDESTDNLIDCCTQLNQEKKLCVEIIAQTIQAYPKEAAAEAWGFVPVSG